MHPNGGTVTILFTDIVGSTSLQDRLGDDRAEELRRTHFQLIREAVAAWRGTEVKSLGDGHMVVFASALDAVGCAIAIQEAVGIHNAEPDAEQLQVRIGINAGEVFQEEADYFGTPVIVARRLCDSASGGQILVSDVVASLVGSRGQFSFRPMAPLQLRGLSQPTAAREVLWQPTTDTDARPSGWLNRRRALIGGAAAVVLLAAVAAVSLGHHDSAGDTPGPPRPTQAGTGVALRLVSQASGTLTPNGQDAERPFSAHAGDVLHVKATRTVSAEDLFLELRGPDGAVLGFDDDSGIGSEPEIPAVVAPRDGTYRVVVSEHPDSPPGGFHLTVQAGGQPPAVGRGPWFGELTVAKSSVSFPVAVQAGTPLTVHVTRDFRRSMDCVLELRDATGKVIASDAGSGEFGNPLIRGAAVKASGTWRVVVRAATPDQHGAFRVDVSQH